ncbi:uncharacterized protein MJAP1_003358 [Malassezia japonica]|uniref:Uncharacterized protein n=1 Tax=Malassezia japonica TaxID=223818 RepID=A0AAF0F8R1_9BASI|nr:uncharacterized protein MJAP1_003358 [Malassezia japonica]WFD40372.1 hypothetical protein MJAP1_003358 [Malassezia japonica]
MASAPPASVPDAAGDVSVSPAGAALQARPKQEAHTLAALERLLAELETTHLPATRQAGDAMLEKVHPPERRCDVAQRAAGADTQYV